MSKVLLFGGGLQVLSISRSLKENGHGVDVLGDHNEVSRKGRFVDACFPCDLSALKVEWMLGFINNHQYDVIIPMEDAFSDWLSLNKQELEARTRVHCAVMDWDVYQLASNKSSLMSFCEDKGLPHPKTKRIGSDLDAVAEYVGFPALIKPNRSNGARGITKVDSIEQFKSIVSLVTAEYGESALQEYLCAKPYYYNVMLYRGKDGAFANHCIVKILRYYPVKGGSSSLCVTIENNELLEICRETLDVLHWVGFADFDILEKGDGDYRIIEINPRVPACVRASAVSGINFAEILVAGALDKAIPVYEYKTGKYLRCLGLDLAWFLSSSERFQARPSWFRFFGKDVFYMEGGKKDFVAMCTSLWMGIKKQLNPEFRKKKAGMN